MFKSLCDHFWYILSNIDFISILVTKFCAQNRCLYKPESELHLYSSLKIRGIEPPLPTPPPPPQSPGSYDSASLLGESDTVTLVILLEH